MEEFRRFPEEPAITAAHDSLAQSGTFLPVSPETAEEERAWLDCDLASLAENQLGDVTHPRALDDSRRRQWRRRFADGREYSLSVRGEYDRCYWIIDGGVRVGTVALAASIWGRPLLRLSSFYIYPESRGQGFGAKALAAAQRILASHNLGLRLETSWCWQRAVHFYLGRGMWVRMWKHDLVFCSDPWTPEPRIEVSADSATLSVERNRERITLAHARRHGDALELAGSDPALERNKSLGEEIWLAQGTLSLAIALRGWPLVRSAQHWKENYWADAGPPESLAYKITIWEAWHRKHGWLVQTPRIAGLGYPTWNDLETHWKARE